MIRMIQRRLIIPRGDTGSFSIPYLKAINPGDVAVFTIFDTRTKTKMYQKLIAAEGDILNIAFTHGDTVNLKPGKYLWDIKFYTNPQIIDDELVNGDEVDSYYAGFSLPECEIRETGDTLLTSDDAPTSTISPESLNIINAAINEILNTKRITVEAAETASLKADAAAESAEDASNSASAASQSAALAEARVNEIENLSVEVDTGLEGTDASVTYTPSTGVLSFIIPRGNTGNGIASCVLNNDFTLTINYTNGDSTTTIPIRGDTPHLTIGEVTEGPHAIATITGTDANPILNLTLPNANVPTRVSQLENDSGYLTEHQDLSNYVQKTDYATSHEAGIVKIGAGLTIDGSFLTLYKASNNQIKQGTASYSPIVPSIQERSTFYGLAKAAGDTTQSQSSNAVGVYTEEAKTAIQQMLDVPSTSDIPTQVSELTNDAGYLTTETDPTVPAWAKAAQKPSYTAAEVGAPTVQEMNSAISTAIGNINSFDMAVVQELPTQDISTHTIYLVPKTGETNDVYDEYVYINSNWEMVGNTQVDLSNYVQKTDYATSSEAGVVKISTIKGLAISSDGTIETSDASVNQLKAGTDRNSIISSRRIGQATFYGLAKAAGDTTQSASSNAVGTYTDEAKAAIQQMLDVPAKDDIPTNVSELNNDSGYLTSYTETDPTVPQWAKASTKPSYTATEVGALPSDTHIPSTTAELTNDAGFITAAEVPEVPVQDVQVDGVSVLDAQGVANVPLAENGKGYGLIRVSTSYGHQLLAGILAHKAAALSTIKSGGDTFDPIVSSNQHAATFYGLAKAAGADMKNIANTTVGTYPDAQKEAIQSMLGITQMLAPENPNLVASQPYAIGDVFASNGHLYKATTAIAQDGTIIPDTNCVETTMVDAGGKIKDVQVNGVSIVQNGVANVPVASSNNLGVVKFNSGQGITRASDNSIAINPATDGNYKNSNDALKPVTTQKQHMSVFYGLAKAAGADEKNSTLPVGQYTDTAKSAIRSMIGATSSNVISVQGTQPTDPDTKIWIDDDASGSVQVPTVSEMESALAGKVSDVQVNGTSVVSGGVANVPVATNSVLGVVKIGPGLGLSANGLLTISSASSSQIKNGTSPTNALKPDTQHESTFYGLAKAAGADMAQSSNAIGTYTDAAKTAIKNMIGVEEGLRVVRLI